jgi:dTDP-glucose 4,6-dehydratase
VSRILITGGGGFIGRNLISFLLKNTDHQIVSINRSETMGLYEGNDRLKIIYCDLKDPIGRALEKTGEIDYIIHFAGSTDAKKSTVEPIKFVMNNVVGTANLLEYARRNATNLKKFLYFSTAEVFGGAPTGTIFKEDDAPSPQSPYAATKIAAEQLCAAYMHTYGLPVVVAYSMNSYGPHQAEDKFIPLMIKKISMGEKTDICLNPEGDVPNRRNYLHVDDLCDSIMFLIERGIAGEKYNISADVESNNLEVAQMLAKILNKKLNYRLVKTVHNHLVLPRLSGEKLHQLGWHQKKTLEEGLKGLIEWKKTHDH